MSLMGYTENDIEEMMSAIVESAKALPADFNPIVINILADTVDFLEGLLEEGRV